MRYTPSVALTSLDPLWSLATVSYQHGYLVWDTLFAVDQNLTPRPQAVEHAEASSDELTWTFVLREGQTFHDNEPVRATDVVASVRRWTVKDPFGQALAAAAEEIEPLDDRRFRIRLKRPFRQMLFALGSRSVFIMPERIARTPPTEQVKEIIGSGPFRFLASEFVAGSTSTYARFDRYVPRSESPDLWAGGKVVHFDRVEWKAQPDASIAVAALQNGETDWVEQPLLDLVPLLQKSPRIKVESVDPFGSLAMLRFNHLIPPFDNPALRRALLPAIDQQSVVTGVVGDQAQFGRYPVGMFPDGSPMSNNGGLSALTSPRDVARARRLIEESGYKGERIVMIAPSDLPAISAMSQIVQDQLVKLGLNIDFQVTDWGTMIARLAKREPIAEGGWNCFCVTWAGLTVSTPGSSFPLRANGQGATLGWPTDEKLESLRDEWFASADLDAQKAVARRIQEQAFVSVPFIPLGQWYQPAGYSQSLTGIIRSPFSVFWNVRRV